MASFGIKVINVGRVEEGRNSRGSTYQKMEVVYKRLDSGKTEGKQLVEFSNKDVFVAAQRLEKEKEYTITIDKDKNGYWQWIGISEGSNTPASSSADSVSPGPAVGGTSSRESATTGRVLGSNYETPAERALKQKYIIAQSSLSSAIAYFASRETKGVTAGPDVIIDTANVFYTYVMSKAQDLSDLKSDIPE